MTNLLPSPFGERAFLTISAGAVRNYVSDAQNQANQVVMIGFVLCSGVL